MDRDRVFIADASPVGLIIKSGTEQAEHPWEEVTDISAGYVPHGNANILVLAIGMEDGRTLVVGEPEPIWPKLTALLSDALPETVPFHVWAAELVRSPGTMTIFERPRPASNDLTGR